MKLFAKIISVLLIMTMFVGLLPVMAQTLPFTIASEQAHLQTDEENQCFTLTYPRGTKEATFTLIATEETVCTLFSDTEYSQPITPTDQGVYTIQTNGKYTDLYLRSATGDTYNDYALTLITPLNIVKYSDYGTVADWALPYVDYCNRLGTGLIRGDEKGNVCPTAPLSRYEMTVIAARMLGVDTSLYKNVTLPYADGISKWARASVAAMTELGIIDGNRNGESLTFDGQKDITREQVAKIMVNIALLSSDTSATAKEIYQANYYEYNKQLISFADHTDISRWAEAYMAMAVCHYDLLQGEKKGGNQYLYPGRTISRQEMITIVARQSGYSISEALTLLLEDSNQALEDADNPSTPNAMDLENAISLALSVQQYGTDKERLQSFKELFACWREFVSQKLIYLSPERRVTNTYTGVDTNESDQMYAVAQLMKPQLEALGYNVYIADIAVTINERGVEAGDMNADIYVAIHSNAAGGPNNGSAQGSIIFHSNNPGSEELAMQVSNKLSALTPTKDRGISNDSLAAHPFAEIRIPTMANILVEVEFHDYPIYAQWIVNHKAELATAMVEGIHQYFINN